MIEVKWLWNIAGVVGNKVAQNRTMFILTTNCKKAWFVNNWKDVFVPGWNLSGRRNEEELPGERETVKKRATFRLICVFCMPLYNFTYYIDPPPSPRSAVHTRPFPYFRGRCYEELLKKWSHLVEPWQRLNPVCLHVYDKMNLQFTYKRMESNC